MSDQTLYCTFLMFNENKKSLAMLLPWMQCSVKIASVVWLLQRLALSLSLPLSLSLLLPLSLTLMMSNQTLSVTTAITITFGFQLTILLLAFIALGSSFRSLIHNRSHSLCHTTTTTLIEVEAIAMVKAMAALTWLSMELLVKLVEEGLCACTN